MPKEFVSFLIPFTTALFFTAPAHFNSIIFAIIFFIFVFLKLLFLKDAGFISYIALLLSGIIFDIFSLYSYPLFSGLFLVLIIVHYLVIQKSIIY
ncbi:hypothetical protein HRbin34_00219 [bacterium HR34]|nr:hypothetical protein HRbin34_00219 [bacterium HR34]